MKSKLFRLTMLLIVMFIVTEPGGETPSAWPLEPSAAGKAPNEAAVENAIAFSVYITEKGDTLETIAGKRQIYDSPLKWPLIYFLNRDDLMELGLPQEELPQTPLPAGITLAYLRADEAQKKMAQVSGMEKRWVVNIISSENQRDIYQPAIKLMENGHFAYIAEWSYNGKNWKRLRTGFFKDQQAAAEAGRNIVKALNLQTFWALEAEWKEVNEHAAFAEFLVP